MNVVESVRPDGTAFVPVHWVYRRPGEAEWRVACMPAALEMCARHGLRVPPLQRTDDPRAVACPFCRDTQEFRDAANQYPTEG